MLADSPGSRHSSRPLQSHTYFHFHAPSIQAYGRYMQMESQCLLFLLYLSTCTVVSFIIQPITVVKVHAHVLTHTHTFILPLSCLLAYNIHIAGGQRAICYIRSASSNSKGHQSPCSPIRAILHRTLRWKDDDRQNGTLAQWKHMEPCLAKVCF